MARKYRAKAKAASSAVTLSSWRSPSGLIAPNMLAFRRGLQPPRRWIVGAVGWLMRWLARATRHSSSVSGRNPGEVIGDHFRHAASQLLRGRDVEKLVGPVGTGVRSQHPGDHKLRLWEPLAQHSHEWNGAAFAHIGNRIAEVVIRGRLEAALEPR